MQNAGQRARPNTSTSIEYESDWIRVNGEGVSGGKYYYKTYHDGASEAFYVNLTADSSEYQGDVVVARLTDSDAPVPVKQGYDDIRGERDN